MLQHDGVSRSTKTGAAWKQVGKNFYSSRETTLSENCQQSLPITLLNL